MVRNCPQRKDKAEYTGKGGNARTLITRSVHATPMSAIPGVEVTKSAPEGLEMWNANSDSIEDMTPDATALTEYKPAALGDMVEVADKTLLPVQEYGGLTLELQQPGGITAVTLQKVAHVPALRRNLLSTRRASERSGEPFVNYPNKTQLGLGKNTICTFGLGETGLFEVMGRRCSNTENRALSSRALLLRGVMEMHRLLGHPSEKITRDTAKKLGVELSGPWTPCVACSKAKARRNAVPKSTNTRSTRRAGRFFVDLGGSMPATSLGDSKYAMICVDDFSRIKIFRFLKKGDASAALRNIIAEYTTPAGLKIGSIRTDEGGEFEGEFQQVFDSHGITHEFTPLIRHNTMGWQSEPSDYYDKSLLQCCNRWQWLQVTDFGLRH